MPSGYPPPPLGAKICSNSLYSCEFGIIEADTSVADDGSAAIPLRVTRIKATFEFGGYFDYKKSLRTNQNKDAPFGSSSDFREIYPAVRQEILADPLAIKSLQAFIAEQKRTYEIYKKSGGTAVFPPSVLTQAQVKTLFTAVCKSVEENTKQVAAPNNVRLITKCGRFNSTVEGRWPICKR